MNLLDLNSGDDPFVRLESIKSLNEEFWKQLRAKESIPCQKFRSKWLREGYSNTRFFHSCVKGNRRRTQLTALKVGEEWIDDVLKVKRLVRSHFENNYSESKRLQTVLGGVSFSSLSYADNEYLTASFSMEEIKEVVWS